MQFLCLFLLSSTRMQSTAFAPVTKPLDVSNMDVVFRGKVWSHLEDPTSKNVIHLLERDESIVTWLQPKGGSVEDQVPAINVQVGNAIDFIESTQC